MHDTGAPCNLHDYLAQTITLAVPARRLVPALLHLLRDLLPESHHASQKTSLHTKHLKNMNERAKKMARKGGGNHEVRPLAHVDAGGQRALALHAPRHERGLEIWRHRDLNRGLCFVCLLAGKVGGVTCCDHAHFERHDMAQQLSSEVRVTCAGAASRGHNSHLSLNHSCIGTQSSAVCCCCQRSIATRPCMNTLRRLMRRHAVAIFVAASDSLGLGLAYTKLREPTAAESDAMLRGGVMG